MLNREISRKKPQGGDFFLNVCVPCSNRRSNAALCRCLRISRNWETLQLILIVKLSEMQNNSITAEEIWSGATNSCPVTSQVSGSRTEIKTDLIRGRSTITKGSCNESFSAVGNHSWHLSARPHVLRGCRQNAHIGLGALWGWRRGGGGVGGVPAAPRSSQQPRRLSL